MYTITMVLIKDEIETLDLAHITDKTTRNK